jgi:hypothetical protein
MLCVLTIRLNKKGGRIHSPEGIYFIWAKRLFLILLAGETTK